MVAFSYSHDLTDAPNDHVHPQRAVPGGSLFFQLRTREMCRNIIKIDAVLGSFSRVDRNFLKIHIVFLAAMGQSGIGTI